LKTEQAFFATRHRRLNDLRVEISSGMTSTSSQKRNIGCASLFPQTYHSVAAGCVQKRRYDTPIQRPFGSFKFDSTMSNKHQSAWTTRLSAFLGTRIAFGHSFCVFLLLIAGSEAYRYEDWIVATWCQKKSKARVLLKVVQLLRSFVHSDPLELPVLLHYVDIRQSDHLPHTHLRRHLKRVS
jgi:hypothetical protein